MGVVTCKPESALGYQGDSPLSNSNYWIGRPYGFSSSFTVRYAFRLPKKLKGFVAVISGRKEGIADGQFLYALSVSPDFPKEWQPASASGNTITVTHTGELAANVLWYLFVSKSTAGNYVYFDGCSAENVSITGEAVGSGHVYRNGAWRELEPKIYRGGVWRSAAAKGYKGEWGERT